MNRLYPLKFHPVPKERVWGGTCLKDNFFREHECELPIGESLDLCGLENDSSIVSEGYLADNPLDDIIETYLGDIVGDDKYQYFGNLFPIIIKKLDIQDYLSVQIHPDDIAADEREGSLGKKEVWYIKDCDKDARIYLGFKRDVTAAEVYERCKNGTIASLMNEIIPEKGDFYIIEPGCVHAAGGGIRLFEISQASDITYRLYDWEKERLERGIKYIKRETHLEECLDLIDCSRYDIGLHKRSTGSNGNSGAEGQTGGETTVEDCREFKIKHFHLKDKLHIYTEKFESFIIYSCVNKSATILYNNTAYRINEGESALIPASLDDFTISPDEPGCEIIECYMGKMEEADGYIEGGSEENIKS